MTKQDYITKFLEKVQDIWEPAKWFLVLMNHSTLDDKQIDKIFSIFSATVDSIQDENKKQKLQKAVDMISQIKEKENKSESNNLEQDLDKILSDM